MRGVPNVTDIAFGAVWSFAANCFGPFYHVFMFEQLDLSAFDVGLLATLAQLSGALSLPAWGLLLDRFGLVFRELIEREIQRFYVVEHDGMIVGSAALYPFPSGKAAELAALVVKPESRGAGVGDKLLEHISREAKKRGLRKLFVLTTQAAHWFIERGFVESDVSSLPEPRRSLYNYQRRSKVLVKTL